MLLRHAIPVLNRPPRRLLAGPNHVRLLPLSALLGAGLLPALDYAAERLLAPGALVVPQQVQVLPSVDPVTHTGQIRLGLPAGIDGLAPGLFARVWLPTVGASQGAQAGAERVYLPSSAIVRRAEMTGVYVVNAQGKPSLRQVRLGPTLGDRVEILSGLRTGDKVAAEPQLAGAVR